MSLRLPSALLLGCAALLLLASSAAAQIIRPSQTLYLGLRGGATAYGGDIDGTGDEDEYGYLFDPLGWAVGGEIGYQLSRGLGLGLNVLYGTYPALDNLVLNPANPTAPPGQLNEDDDVLQIQPMFRYTPWGGARISPYVLAGATFAWGQGEDTDNDGGTILGMGPVLGLGLDFLIGRQLSFFLEGHTAFIVPDDAIDFANPSANPTITWADRADYDNLNFYGAGFRYYFRPAVIRITDVEIECVTELMVGETGTFTASVRPENATTPIEYLWNFGDGTTATGMTATHAFSAPGTYTVTFTARGPRTGNERSDTCLVNVRMQPPDVVCRVTPTSVRTGEQVTVDATVTGGTPVTVSVDFGDGTRASSVPARHAYNRPGTYTVTVTATNQGGTDTCTSTVRVEEVDTFCDEVTELNTVFFGYESSTLDAAARSRLDENIEVLRRCPEICVTINGYTDDTEDDKLRLSQRRADEVRAYYVANGIGDARLRASGQGEYPACDNKDDPGPGNRDCRRAESIPVPCPPGR